MTEYIMIEVADETGVFADVRKPLIRCRDCKHHKGYNCDRLYGMQDAFMARDNDYCSWAERKDDDTR